MSHPAGRLATGWVPSSPCGPCCLPVAAPASAGPALRLAARLTALVAVILATLLSAPLPALVPAARTGWLRRVCRLLLAALGIRLVVHGPRRLAGQDGALVVANHLSWVEVLALMSVQPLRLVAKRELRGWPVVGRLAAATGALFIDRRGLRGLPATLAEMEAALRAGHPVGVFPEGTTWCGTAAGPFRTAPFQTALDAGAPVQPVAVTLRVRGRVAPEAAFVGGEQLLPSMRRILRLSGLVCELTVLPPLPPRGDRRELARRCAAAVAAATGVPHPDRRAGLAVPAP